MSNSNMEIGMLDQCKSLREAEVLRLAGGISGMTLRRWMALGKFPKPIMITGRRYWAEPALIDWRKQLEVA